MDSEYQRLMAEKRARNAKEAVQAAKSWWKTEGRYVRQAQYELWDWNKRSAICVVIPVPYEGTITVVRQDFFLSKERSFSPSPENLARLREIYKAGSSSSWEVKKGSDCVVMLCNSEEEKNLPGVLVW